MYDNRILVWTIKLIGLFLVLTIASVGSAEELFEAEGYVSADQEQVIEGSMVVQPSVKTINGGINPEFFGYRIEGLILKGANDCLALGSNVEIHSYVRDGVLYLILMRVLKPDMERVCPSLSQPIFELGRIDVRYSRKEVQKVVIKNVGTDLEDFAFVP